MIEVIINHHKTTIKSGPKEEINRLINACKVVYSHWEGSKRIYEKTINLFDYDENSFPTGYLFILADKISDIEIEAEDHRVYNVGRIRLPSTSFEDNWDSQNKFTEIIREENTGLIISPTGTGKSRFIEIIIDEKRTRTLVVVPTITIRDSLVETLGERFGTSNVTNKLQKINKKLQKLDKNKFYSKAIDINADVAESVMTPEEEYLYKKGYRKIGNKMRKVTKSHATIEKEMSTVRWPSILVICINSLDTLPEEYLESVETFIVDEGHTAGQERIRNASLCMPNAMYRYALSATMWRDRKEDMLVLMSTFGNNVIFEETYQEAVDSNKIKKVKYIQDEIPLADEYLGNIKNVDDIIKRCFVANTTRNQKIIDVAINYIDQGRKVMICVTESAHCEIFKKRFEQRGIKVLTFYSKLDKEIRDEVFEITKDYKNSEPFIVIATNALGIGADTKAIDTVIFADIRKASTGLFQKPGRGIRKIDFENPDETLIIHDFFDRLNPITLEWSKERKKLINQYYFSNESFTKKMAKKHGISLI